MNALKNLVGWVDDRFPLMAMWNDHLAKYYAPKNFNFWYFFGSLALLVLVIQIVTGIFLAMHYKPSAAEAFNSVEYIMRDVEWGWLMRYLHSTGASAFFVVVYLHMFRGLLYGSYKQPRELIWILGMLIYLCLMAEAFFGYLLPWGQMSFWGAQVIISLFGAIPVVGEELAIWIRGDFVVSDATLNRFFSFHIILVPAVDPARPGRRAHPGAARGRFEQPGRRRDQEEERREWHTARRHSVPPVLHGQGHRRRGGLSDPVLADPVLRA
jgi:ubiquinol-cytochrome c reductase cytochrome b subunit